MPPTLPTPRPRVWTVFRWLLGLLLLFTGHGHLTWARSTFQAQVPSWVPMNPDRVVVLSGIVELSLGAALILLRRQQVAVGWIVAAFFVAIFPGNVAQYANRVDAFGLNSDTTRPSACSSTPCSWRGRSGRPAPGRHGPGAGRVTEKPSRVSSGRPA